MHCGALQWLDGGLHGAGDASPALQCAFEVAADREAVWGSFVATGEPRPYYFDAVLQADLHPGGRWRFVTDDRQRLIPTRDEEGQRAGGAVELSRRRNRQARVA